jgi:hypothetical protein
MAVADQFYVQTPTKVQVWQLRVKSIAASEKPLLTDWMGKIEIVLLSSTNKNGMSKI